MSVFDGRREILYEGKISDLIAKLLDCSPSNITIHETREGIAVVLDNEAYDRAVEKGVLDG